MKQVNVRLPSLDTPAVLVDMDKLEMNISEASRLAADAGVKLRPHSKCHESAEIARMQIKAGAIGISSSKLDEAERMAEEGIDDLMVVHPFYGDFKLEKLKKLLSKPKLKLGVVVDMIEQAEGISQVGQALGMKVPVHLKIDCGVKRFGVLPGEPALNLAKKLCQLPGIELVGILSHESTHGERTADGVDRLAREVAALMSTTARLLRMEGIQIKDVTLGSTPTLRDVPILKYFPEITEIHPGMYIFGDVMYISNHAVTEDRCALTVLTTVISVSASSPPRAVIDAGSKALTPDALIHLRGEPGYFWEGKPSFGRVKGRPDLWFGRVPAENGVLYFTDANRKVDLGERLEIIPNNASMVVSIHDQIYGVRDGAVERVLPITGRGLGN